MNLRIFAMIVTATTLATSDAFSQASDSTDALFTLSDRLQLALKQIADAETESDSVFTAEAAIAAKRLAGRFWSDAGPLMVKSALRGKTNDLDLGVALLSCYRRASCAKDRELIRSTTESELPRVKTVVVEISSAVDSASSRARKFQVTPAEEPLRDRVVKSGEIVSSSLKGVLESIDLAIKNSNGKSGTGSQKGGSNSPSESTASPTELEKELTKLQELRKGAADLGQELLKIHGEDPSNKLMRSGGALRFGSLIEIEDSLKPFRSIEVCFGRVACDEDRKLLQSYKETFAHGTISVIDRSIENLTGLCKTFREIELSGADADLRDRTVKVGDDALTSLEKIRRTLRDGVAEKN